MPLPEFIGTANGVADFSTLLIRRRYQAVGWELGMADIMINNRLLGVLLAALFVAISVLGYLYYERTKPVVKVDVPGVSGEITKEGVDIEVGKPKN
jgi:hypothetical protein